jgi:hypothetical protein
MVSLDDRLAFRKREAADALNIGITKLDALLAQGKIKGVKSGHHT